MHDPQHEIVLREKIVPLAKPRKTPLDKPRKKTNRMVLVSDYYRRYDGKDRKYTYKQSMIDARRIYTPIIRPVSSEPRKLS